MIMEAEYIDIYQSIFLHTYKDIFAHFFCMSNEQYHRETCQYYANIMKLPCLKKKVNHSISFSTHKSSKKSSHRIHVRE